MMVLVTGAAGGELLIAGLCCSHFNCISGFMWQYISLFSSCLWARDHGAIWRDAMPNTDIDSATTQRQTAGSFVGRIACFVSVQYICMRVSAKCVDGCKMLSSHDYSCVCSPHQLLFTDPAVDMQELTNRISEESKIRAQQDASCSRSSMMLRHQRMYLHVWRQPGPGVLIMVSYVEET